MVIDPTIEVDGKLIWQAGHLTPAPCRRIGKVFDRWTEFDALFSGQLGDIGLGKVNWRIAWKKG